MKKTILLAICLTLGSVSTLLAQFPGIQIGSTEMENQSFTTTGNRIIVDTSGGIHAAWMKSVNYPATRHIKVNYTGFSSNWVYGDTGQTISIRNKDGYPQVSMTSDNKMVLAYHNALTNPESLYLARETAWGSGRFNYFRIPNLISDSRYLWPYITVDHQGFIHVLANKYRTLIMEGIFAYTRSQNGGATWTPLQIVDSTMCNWAPTVLIVSSPVSNKVAIVFQQMIPSIVSYMYDVYYLESSDGQTWDFQRGKINITNYLSDSDSLYAIGDGIDALYDYDDNLHIVWRAAYLAQDYTIGIYPNVSIRHFSSQNDEISLVFMDTAGWEDRNCDYGSGNYKFGELSLGLYEPTNALFLVYSFFHGSDCSNHSYTYMNGDIYMQYSADLGSTWITPQNITNTHTPDCTPGDCMSEVSPSLADVVDTSLHILYIEDLDAGVYTSSEGTLTNNPVMYLSITNPVQVVPPCGYLMGRIYQSLDSLPVPDAIVKIRRFLQIVGTDTTGEDGSYSISGILPGSYNTVVSQNWYYDNYADSISIISNETTYVDITLETEYPSTLLGGITKLDSLRPIEGAIVWAAKDSLGSFQDTTSTDGMYEIDMLHEGFYHLRISASGHVSKQIDSVFVSRGDTAIENISLISMCNYLLGDINGNSLINGIDVVYAVKYFKGGEQLPHYPCDCPPMEIPFFAVGDVNGDCAFNGPDITYMVNYFKGGALFIQCHNCPSSR
jgi:hypothetical protein